jgi:hypothetical protein
VTLFVWNIIGSDGVFSPIRAIPAAMIVLDSFGQARFERKCVMKRFFALVASAVFAVSLGYVEPASAQGWHGGGWRGGGWHGGGWHGGGGWRGGTWAGSRGYGWGGGGWRGRPGWAGYRGYGWGGGGWSGRPGWAGYRGYGWYSPGWYGSSWWPFGLGVATASTYPFWGSGWGWGGWGYPYYGGGGGGYYAGYPSYSYPSYSYPNYAYTTRAPVVTGRSVASGNVGRHCTTQVRMCLLRNASFVGNGCSCKVSGGRARGTVTP